MAETHPPAPEVVSRKDTDYQPEAYMHPEANLTAFLWLALLGIPALLLFLIFYKG